MMRVVTMRTKMMTRMGMRGMRMRLRKRPRHLQSRSRR